MKLFSVCPTCDLSPKPYDGRRQWGDFDKCPKCGEVMDVWTESGVRNEEARRKWGAIMTNQPLGYETWHGTAKRAVHLAQSGAPYFVAMCLNRISMLERSL